MKKINFEDVAHTTAEEYFSAGGEFSINTYKSKYPNDDVERQFPSKLFWRVAKTAAQYEATPELQEYWAQRWFSEFWNGIWRPGGSVLAGLGIKGKVSISNCTTIELKEDNLESIFETGLKVAKAAAYRQGLGVDFSALRSRGSIITNSAKISTGAISWMDFINTIGKHVGQCLHPQTNLLTTEGYKTIKDIVRKKSESTIFCPTGTSKIINWFENPEKNIYELTTEYGDRLLLSKEHILAGIDKEKPLEDFKKGDFLVSRRITDYPETKYVSIPDFTFIESDYNKSNRISIPPKYPDTVNEKLAYILGLVYGDGYITKKRSIEFALGLKWPKVKNKVNRFLIDLFDAQIGSYGLGIRKGDGNLERVSMGRWYYEFFNSIGCIKGKSSNLIFPEVIKNSPKSVLFAFISGMFDADGYNSMSRKNIEMCSIDYNFMYTLKLELAKYGVIVNLGTSKYLTPLNKFKRSRCRLSFVGTRSRSIFCNETLSEKLALGNNIPSCDRLKTPYKLKDLKISIKNTDNDVNASDYLSDVKYEKYSDRISKLYIQKIKKVKKIKNKCVTYDITIDDPSHLFFADNLLIKNSGRIPAMLFSLKVDHPDILEFISAKSNQHMIPNANISVQITDDFMQAYEENKDWTLSFEIPDNNETITKTIKAKELMKLLAQEACDFAEPGVQFIDTCIKESMTDAVGYPIKSTNACSEKFMTPDSTCILASLNVGYFSFENYEKDIEDTAKSMVRFLDNCVQYELNENKTPYKEQKNVVSQLREIGLGVTNLNGWLIKENLNYDSDKGIESMVELIKHFSLSAWKETISLGKEKGNAPAFQNMLDKMNGDNSFIYQSTFARRLRDDAGIDITHCRNLNVMSIAPTGSISLVFPQNIESTGIEPFIGFYYWKRSRAEGFWKWYFVIPDFVKRKLEQEGHKDIPSTIHDDDGSIGEKWSIIINKYFNPEIFKPAHHIDPLKKIEFMSKVQKWIDSSISVTYNLVSTAKPSMVEEIYYQGWKQKVKAMAIYRDKSRQGVIEFESPKKVERRFERETDKTILSLRPEAISFHPAAKRPKELPCNIHRTSIKGTRYIILMGLLHGIPYEIFVAKEEDLKIPHSLDEAIIVKNGSGTYNLIRGDKSIIKDISTHINNHDYEDRTRLISLNLRTGTPIDYVVEQLEKSKGSIVEASQAISRILKKYIGEYYRKTLCSDCGSSQVDYREGCFICLDCGFSKCG